MEGTIGIQVHNLAVLKAMGRQIAKATSEALTVTYHVTDAKMIEKAQIQSKQNAVIEARKQGGFLAKAAGTRIIGVLEVTTPLRKRRGFYSLAPMLYYPNSHSLRSDLQDFTWTGLTL